MEAELRDAIGIADAPGLEESWRLSRAALRALSRQAFAAADAAAPVADTLRAAFAWPQTDGRRLVFVNGVHAPALSSSAQLGDIAALVGGEGGMPTLTLEGTQDGPIHFVHVYAPVEQASRWQASSRIEVRGGTADIIEQHVGAAGADVLGTLQTTIEVGSGAQLRIATLVDLPDSASLYRRTDIRIDAAARCETAHAILGGRFQRFDIDVELAAARAGFGSSGVFALRGRQHADIHLDIRHAARDTACDVVWRGVADQRARGIFHGAITVAAGADGADAQLSNKNLLLSAHAEIDTQPVLEIHADEVKAAHGATVGQLDERALFYLRSRGIPVEAARQLLIGAFCRSVFASLADANLRERIDALLDARLPGSGERP